MRDFVSRVARLLACVCLASACATSEAPRALVSEPHEDGGFAVHERVRVSSRVRADFERAVELLTAERYPDGIALLTRVTEAAPHLVVARVDLGIAYARVGDLERAEASLVRALELAPDHAVAQNELGIVYRRSGRFQQARDHYERALARHPAYHLARKNLAILCDLYLVDLDCALEHYTLYVQAVPEDRTAAMWIEDVRARNGR